METPPQGQQPVVLLTQEEVQELIEYLGQHPYRIVAPVIGILGTRLKQAQKAHQSPMPPAPDPSTPTPPLPTPARNGAVAAHEETQP